MLTTSSKTVLPAEWDTQSGIMLTWPHAHGDWSDQLPEIEKVFVSIAHAISRYEAVIIACFDDTHSQHVRTLLGTNDAIALYIAESNDSWVRDHGPLTVWQHNKLILLDFIFNGWGNKYPAELDNGLSRKLHADNAFSQTAMASIDMVLEGGSIDSDGDGTLLTTSRCLLAPTRNGNTSKSATERLLQSHLGAETVLWLDNGELAGDDTDGHIDMLARFCASDMICYMHCDDTTDFHYSPLHKMAIELEAFRQPSGEPYQLVSLPLPDALYASNGQRLPASYANFLIINSAVLVPVYGVKQDETACATLADCFPGRQIVPINCRALIEQHGSLHCVTMQLPAGVLAS